MIRTAAIVSVVVGAVLRYAVEVHTQNRDVFINWHDIGGILIVAGLVVAAVDLYTRRRRV